MAYYWNTGQCRGREVIMGPYTDESEAHQMGFRSYDGGYFDTHELPTRDQSAATRMIKHKKLNGGATLNEALSPMGHVNGGFAE